MRMLQVKNISKKYITGDLVQVALDNVSLNLRDNEFVAILGPSGSGKTTLLNIIGGLDRYDSGDLIINGISTKKYKDRDWDSYRNHTIGFVFQSYNLISHQSILSNVELALTISGVSRSERRKRAIDALKKVGLGDQIHKKPTQMSGGQMQRVAIARALVNDPDILLADEPTGALDSETSIQVMDLLKEVAKDKLVVMVTHNPELAEQYATRIVNLSDGRIVHDSDPYKIDEASLAPPQHKNMGKSSMSFLTAVSLSFNNLKSKLTRTLLTAFAGSIGIIGIALIMSLSTGINNYIADIEEDTLSEYPVQILSTGLDFTSLMTSDTGDFITEGDEDSVTVTEMISTLFSRMDNNDLEALREYFESGDSDIWEYAKAIEYVYDIEPQIYLENEDSIVQVNPNNSLSTSYSSSTTYLNMMMSLLTNLDMFYQMPDNESLYEDQYEIKAGRWPERYDECVLVLTSAGSISDMMLYSLGLKDYQEYLDMVEQYNSGQDISATNVDDEYTYEDILNVTYKLVISSDYYTYDNEYGIWIDKSDDEDYMQALIDEAEELKIVGIVQPAEDATSQALSSGINYTASLVEHIVEKAADSDIVQAQLENPGIDVLTGEPFGEESTDFDISSVFDIDMEALSSAFDMTSLSSTLANSMDLSSMFNIDGSSVDLSSLIDADSLNIDTSSILSSIDMNSLLDGITITANTEDITSLATSLLEGYQNYAASNNLADYNDLAEDFSTYLSSSEAQAIISSFMVDLLSNSDAISISTDSLNTLLNDIVNDYEDYVADQTDPADVTTEAYLSTNRAQEIFDTWASANVQINSDFTISTDSLNTLTTQLASGYAAYAANNSLTDMNTVNAGFTNYLASEEATTLITNAITNMVDTTSLEQQLSTAMTSAMESIAASYAQSIAEAIEGEVEAVTAEVMSQLTVNMEDILTEIMSEMAGNIESLFTIDEEALREAYETDMSSSSLLELLTSYSSSTTSSYDNNLASMGYADLNTPTEIDIYPYSFESKDGVIQILDDYNARMSEKGEDDKVISYTDTVGTLMSSVTTIVNVISYALIAFVSISLIVSSIMIGIITYVSVLERTREIGILRAIGASKNNISEIFNAETFIIGLAAGIIGIVLSLLLLIPGNAFIHYMMGTEDVVATLPVSAAIALIILSVILSFIAGLIPSRQAARKDPVTALRTE